MRIISGMHRSGTSLVARLCFEAGANLGDPATFYRPDRWNPDGYYEQPDIHAINMPLINGPWGKLAYFWPPSTATVMRRAARRADQITAAAERYRTAIVKETRFCLTLPAWRAYGATVEGVCVCLREPLHVAQSLRRRNHISLRRGLNLWLLHCTRLIKHTQDLPVWFVSYRHLLSPEYGDRELRSFLRFLTVDISDEVGDRLRDTCVKPGLNHAAAKPPAYPPEVAALWEALQQRHAQQFA